jgi:DDB1- and CUL4-associated factor 8
MTVKLKLDQWIRRRECGLVTSLQYQHGMYVDPFLVRNMRFDYSFDEHDGCVNTVSFTQDGNYILSGSDDRQIFMLDWIRRKVVTRLNVGHFANVFQAKTMYNSNNSEIVSCGADGRVIHSILRHDGVTVPKLLASHRGRAHKLALRPDMPDVVVSCGEDHLLHVIDLRSSDPISHSVLFDYQLNSVASSPAQPNLLCVAGDSTQVVEIDMRGLHAQQPVTFSSLGAVRMMAPRGVRGFSHVTCAVYSHDGCVLASYSGNKIFLFPNSVPTDHSRVE